MKRNSEHFSNFLTYEIEKNILLFYCFFNFIPKYIIIVLYMINCLIIKIPYYFSISLFTFFILCFSNIYLYLFNKHLTKTLDKFNYYFAFYTTDYKTHIAYKKLVNSEEISTQKAFDINLILKEWVKLKENQTFIYYSISTKTGFNIYLNCIYSGLLLSIICLYFIL